jgi:hypothetical protein
MLSDELSQSGFDTPHYLCLFLSFHSEAFFI